MDNLVKVDGYPGFAKDKSSGAILNINSNEIARRKEIKQRQRELVAQHKQEIQELKDEISEIKSLLYSIVENNK